MLRPAQTYSWLHECSSFREICVNYFQNLWCCFIFSALSQHMHKSLSWWSSVQEDGTETTSQAMFVLTEEVRCPVPQCSGKVVQLAVSNNAINISNTLGYLCYDSVCDNCTMQGCTPRVRALIYLGCGCVCNNCTMQGYSPRARALNYLCCNCVWLLSLTSAVTVWLYCAEMYSYGKTKSSHLLQLWFYVNYCAIRDVLLEEELSPVFFLCLKLCHERRYS